MRGVRCVGDRRKTTLGLKRHLAIYCRETVDKIYRSIDHSDAGTQLE